jgi:oxygen-independent coproporphyrinogen-3 oxidase
MGVQSFNNVILKMNGRVHLEEDVLRAFGMIRDAGFHHVNLDLMCGLPGESPAQWHDTVRKAIKLGPESITLYQTEEPHNTQLYRDLKAGNTLGAPSTWQTKRTRLLYGFTTLERAGYSVVSAYNAVKDPIEHRFIYQDRLWHGGDMIGLGAAAFGYVNGVHMQNSARLEDYLPTVESHRLPLKRAYALSDWEQLVREFILQLKLGELDNRYFIRKYGVDVIEMFAAPIEELQDQGFLVSAHGRVRLTRAGLLRVDWLLPRFYDSAFRDIRYT